MNDEHKLDGDGCILEDMSGVTSRLLLVFGGIAGGLAMPPFEFLHAAQALDDRKIFFRDPRQAWYQYGLPTVPGGLTGLAGYIARRVAESGATEVRFIGNSMGGYAALLLCGLVGVGSVVAFAPQTFISNPRRALTGDARWAGQLGRLHADLPADAVLDLPDWLSRNRPGLQAQVHVSTRDVLDSVHAEALGGLQGIQVHRYNFGGHNLVRELRDRGCLQSLLG